MKILLVDDDINIRRILSTRLGLLNYQVFDAADGEEALHLFQVTQPDLVILDVMMPKLDGYGVCQQIRAISDIPIIMLTALGDIGDKITGLELGADDYVVKPFSPRELEARIKCIFRRSARSGILQIGYIRLDGYKKQVWKHNQLIRLTEMELALLELLMTRAGETLDRSFILQTVWGYTWPTDTRVVDVHISRLRAKLEDDPSHPTFILTARGSGYLIPSIYRT
jgi:OmpR family response regulator RpaB|uniref:Probable transcriptional regulator ycf27 n=1 Tax=Cyanidiaceae sp. MX-AZ01 TaxID=1503164 RepID=A0A060A4Y8_9RHOD|nr:ompR-like transcriptional regulator [Cyanidiaceae sp. MX-AZ01]